jgi:rhomboid protease GluP
VEESCTALLCLGGLGTGDKDNIKLANRIRETYKKDDDMIEERLETALLNLDYRKVNSNAPGIYLFYHTEGAQLTVVSVIRAVTGNELGREQYERILEQIKNNFTRSNPQNIKLLSLILTASPDQVKHFCIDSKEDDHWIIDINAGRLIIYETQSHEFSALQRQIEELLTEEAAARQEEMRAEYYPMQGQREGQKPGYKLLTLVNTGIILVNIIIFIISQFTPVFGGKSQWFAKGALSWYFVIREKEYYRIITSMFMHSDWSHLFNNMLVLLFVGDKLERAAGKSRYLFLYFGSGILAGAASIGYNMWKDNGQFSYGGSVFSIGASGAIFGIVGAMLFIVAINRGRLEGISTRQMALFVVFSLYGGITNTRIDQAAHVGGFLAGLILAAVVYRRPKKVIPSGQPL